MHFRFIKTWNILKVWNVETQKLLSLISCLLKNQNYTLYQLIILYLRTVSLKRLYIYIYIYIYYMYICIYINIKNGWIKQQNNSSTLLWVSCFWQSSGVHILLILFSLSQWLFSRFDLITFVIKITSVISKLHSIMENEGCRKYSKNLFK